MTTTRPERPARRLTDQPLLSVSELGTVLGVWAHPDDEAYLSAGLMAMARAAGQRVVVATATAGDAGGDADQRRTELDNSLAMVGVLEHHWLGYVDGACADVPIAMGAAVVSRLLNEVQPDTILTFGPEGMTGHDDHIAIGRWVDRAWRDGGRRELLLHATLSESFHREWGELNDANGIWMPGAVPPSVADDDLTLQVEVTGMMSYRKLAALRAHASQTTGLRLAVGDDTYRRWWATESFIAADH